MGFMGAVEISTLSGTEREVSPLDDPSKLIADIKKRGQTTPILIRPDLHLIDGLRRVRALESLGISQVEAFTADTWEEVRARLENGRSEENFRFPLTYRPYDILPMFYAVENMGARALSESRRTATIGIKRGERHLHRKPLVPWRQQFFDAVGFDDHIYSDARFMIAAMANIPEGEEELYTFFYEESRNGRLSVHAARKGIENYAMRGDVQRAADQKRIFEKMIHEGEANYRAFKTLGSLTGKHSPEELEHWLEGLKRTRDQYTAMMNVLKRRVGK